MEEILKKLFGEQEGVLSESAQTEITQMLTEKVNEVVEEKVQLQLEAQDKDHCKLLQQLVEQHDKDKESIADQYDTLGAAKIKETFEKLDADRTAKLQQVMEMHEQELSKKVNESSLTIIEAVDSYFDTFLDKHVPADFIAEAVRKDLNEELVSNISRLVGLNAFVTEDVKEGLLDGQRTIQKQAEELNQLRKKEFLRESTQDLPLEQRKFITEALADKDLDYTKRNLEYLKELHEKRENTQISKAQQVITEQKQNVNPTTVVTESAQSKSGEEVMDPAMAGYLAAVEGATNRYF